MGVLSLLRVFPRLQIPNLSCETAVSLEVNHQIVRGVETWVSTVCIR
jgi:hypothetical protein